MEKQKHKSGRQFSTDMNTADAKPTDNPFQRKSSRYSFYIVVKQSRFLKETEGRAVRRWKKKSVRGFLQWRFKKVIDSISGSFSLMLACDRVQLTAQAAARLYPRRHTVSLQLRAPRLNTSHCGLLINKNNNKNTTGSFMVCEHLCNPDNSWGGEIKLLDNLSSARSVLVVWKLAGLCISLSRRDFVPPPLVVVGSSPPRSDRS